MSEILYPLPTAEDLRVMALTIYGEARGEIDEGQIAVGWVIKTRTAQYVQRHGAMINIYAVVARLPYQFSAWNTSDPNAHLLGDSFPLHTPVFAQCVRHAVDVLSNSVPDPTHGATHYLNVAAVLGALNHLPTWAADPHNRRQVNETYVTARIGRHTFLCLP